MFKTLVSKLCDSLSLIKPLEPELEPPCTLLTREESFVCLNDFFKAKLKTETQ